ncbi:hypothetical protein HMPREF9371_2400 [Neisseria shayeganii 871]|uniref:Uncharacterized protein n=1 Tax=Neisseria shayeganii 871 TaxID=1032488 RepID=G4CLA9_9NEIS|nr:hypothetical protein HMPREF9371_2400 [Neisseria shayeganii 871]
MPSLLSSSLSAARLLAGLLSRFSFLFTSIKLILMRLYCCTATGYLNA